MRRFVGHTSTSIWITFGAVLLGFVAGQAWNGGYVEAVTENSVADLPAATATRQAELLELEEFRAQVAQTPPPVICTPAATATATAVPSPTATPTPVPPVSMGQPIPYTGDWIVTVTDFSTTPETNLWTANGTWAIVHLRVLNEGTTARRFPFDDLRLEYAGRLYEPHIGVSNEAGIGYYHAFVPLIPRQSAVGFDIPADAEGPFILESETDPTFRVEVSIERRG